MAPTTQDGSTETLITRRRLFKLAWTLSALGLGAPLVAGCQPANNEGDDEDEDEDDD